MQKDAFLMLCIALFDADMPACKVKFLCVHHWNSFSQLPNTSPNHRVVAVSYYYAKDCNKLL